MNKPSINDIQSFVLDVLADVRGINNHYGEEILTAYVRNTQKGKSFVFSCEEDDYHRDVDFYDIGNAMMEDIMEMIEPLQRPIKSEKRWLFLEEKLARARKLAQEEYERVLRENISDDEVAELNSMKGQ